MSSSTTPQPRAPTTLVLAFDGTANRFDSTNTNVVKFFSLLEKDDPDRQKVYYQTGVGTYPKPGTINPVSIRLTRAVDLAVAWFIDTHIMGGYQYLMKNYRHGDRICLFGFSRGAYTARALAGMLHKVGLLPQDNDEQVTFAYKLYKRSDEVGIKQASSFKGTFSREVSIEFLGAWDTVESVGVLMSRHLPFTNSNQLIKTFRHALSLDERRARFRDNLWHYDAPNFEEAQKDPEHGSGVAGQQGDPQSPTSNNKARPTDIKEVWFAGCHTDVGGGRDQNNDESALSEISLRWMIRECALTQTGILFNSQALERAGIPQDSFRITSAFEDFQKVKPSYGDKPHAVLSATGEVTPSPSASKREAQHRVRVPSSSKVKAKGTIIAGNGGDVKGTLGAPFRATRGPISSRNAGLEIKQDLGKSNLDSAANAYKMSVTDLDRIDALGKMHDQLKRQPLWWILEIFPTIQAKQDRDGRWHKQLRLNLFRPRVIDPAVQPLIHHSVRVRMEAGIGYEPKAKWTQEPVWVE